MNMNPEPSQDQWYAIIAEATAISAAAEVTVDAGVVHTFGGHTCCEYHVTVMLSSSINNIIR